MTEPYEPEHGKEEDEAHLGQWFAFYQWCTCRQCVDNRRMFNANMESSNKHIDELLARDEASQCTIAQLVDEKNKMEGLLYRKSHQLETLFDVIDMLMGE